MKIEFISLAYRNTAPAAGNRLTETLLSTAIYSKPIYLKRLEIVQGRVFDATLVERNITGLEIAVVTSDTGWITRPQSGTLGANTTYAGNRYRIQLDPKNCPGIVELGDIYIPAGSSFNVDMNLYCAGIVATDTVDVLCRVAYQFEATENYFTAEFDTTNINY